MRLDIRFSNRPLEDLWCQAVTALVFQKPDVNSGVISSLDMKLTGTLENILRREAWTGERGEKFLIATQNMIRADKLLLYGLGPSSEFSPAILEQEIGNLGKTLDKIVVNDLGIYLPAIEGSEDQYGYHLEISTNNLVEAFYKTHMDDPDFILKIIFSVEKQFLYILDSAVRHLRKNLRPNHDFTIIAEPARKVWEDENIRLAE